MFTYLKRLLGIGVLMCCTSSLEAQTPDIAPIPQRYAAVGIGQSVPAIPIRKVKNLIGNERTLADFKGKLVIIDFWTTGCPGCIRGFPKMKELQEKFKDQIQILLINPWETEAKVQERLKGSLKDYRLNTEIKLPTIVGDSVWRLVFPHLLVPHHVWIDKDGKVIAQTSGNSTTENTIAKVLKGEKVFFTDKQDVRNFNKKIDALIRLASDSTTNLNCYSMLMPYNAGVPGGSSEVIDTLNKTYRITFRNTAIMDLYAFSNPKPGAPMVFEPGGENNSQPKYDDDKWLVNNLFSYELKLPISSMARNKEYMFEDLNRYLSEYRNITASIQVRKHLTYILYNIALFGNTTVKTKYQHRVKSLVNSYLFINEKHAVLQNALKARLSMQLSQGALFVDESEISPNTLTIFELPKINGDLELLRSYLNKRGLDLRTEERWKETLVIEEKPTNL